MMFQGNFIGVKRIPQGSFNHIPRKLMDVTVSRSRGFLVVETQNITKDISTKE